MSSRGSSLGRRKRGVQSPVKSFVTPETTTNTKSKNSSPYDANFQQHLTNRGIYPPRYSYPDGAPLPEPDNMEEIKRALVIPRRSLSPSQFTEAAFSAFLDADTHAAKEAQVMTRVLPTIEGKVDHVGTGGQIPFKNLEPLTDVPLVPGNPDVYHGARYEQLRPAVREELEGHIVPFAQKELPVAPNFFLEAKGPDGSLAVASRQACYDGALGARGIHSLQSYGQVEQQFDNKAYCLTSIYHGGTLKMFTSHPIPPNKPGKGAEYAMTQIKTWGLTGDADTFRQGVAAYRNGRDWAKRQRDDAIGQANIRAAAAEARASPVGLDPAVGNSGEASAGETVATSQDTAANTAPDTAPGTHRESETSADDISTEVRSPRATKRTKPSSPRKAP